MKTATVTAFRQKMKQHLEDLQNDQDILILSGPRKSDFVVLTLETYNAMEETAHLLSTPANARRLMDSMAQVNAGKALVKVLNIGEENPKRTTRMKNVKRKVISRNRAR